MLGLQCGPLEGFASDVTLTVAYNSSTHSRQGLTRKPIASEA